MLRIKPSSVASDGLVFFGASGDPAYKQIFPTLYVLTVGGGWHNPV